MSRFEGRTAIVTGAATGIGAAITSLLADEGCRVFAADIDAAALNHDATGTTNYVCDVTSAAQVNEMVAAIVGKFGRLDILVNNAGTGLFAEVTDTKDEDWDRVFRTNVTSIMYACRAAVPQMREQGGGAIVNTASISGLGGDYGLGAYNASKGAVINYTRTLALDNARSNIRVNALCPGFISGTRLGAPLAPVASLWNQVIPLGRSGTALEMAKVAAFLASDDASYMTGSIVVADGGMTAHTGQPNLIKTWDISAGSG